MAGSRWLLAFVCAWLSIQAAGGAQAQCLASNVRHKPVMPSVVRIFSCSPLEATQRSPSLRGRSASTGSATIASDAANPRASQPSSMAPPILPQPTSSSLPPFPAAIVPGEGGFEASAGG